MAALGAGAAALATGGYPTRLLALAAPASDSGASTACRALHIADLETLEEQARRLLSPARFAAMNPAGHGITCRANCRAFNNAPILPLRMEDASACIADTRVTLLGHDLSLPIITAPMARQGTFHVQAEVATADGTGMAGSLYVSSSDTDDPLEDIAVATAGPKWVELDMRHAETASRIVRRARTSGFSAIVLAETRGVGFGDVASFRNVSGLPVIVKGILHPQNVERVLAAGASGIWISNAGGRHVDGEPAALVHLREAADAVAGRVPIVFDSGIRRGIDVFKALALGATVVAVGRPVLWGLINGGAPGVQSIYAHLTAELKSAMMLSGVSRVTDIRRDHLALSRSV